MKTFADYLPTLTAREREIVEAFHLATEAWHDDDNPVTGCPIAEMRYTPPAKEPESAEAQVMYHLIPSKTHVRIAFDLPEDVATRINLRWGDPVRVTKIEGEQ